MSKEAMAGEEVEYESDPEEAKLSLKMRRREASDDEEEGGENSRDKSRVRIDSDGEFEGTAVEYEDELEEQEEVEDYEDDEEYVEEEEEVKYEKGGGGKGGDAVEVVAMERVEAVTRGVGEGDLMEERKGVRNDAIENVNDSVVDDGQPEEEKKEIEPYAVPKAGAFYMHDDRFQDSVVGRHRRMFGGRKLWESKDDRKWGHDKFEQLTMQERHYEEHRSSRGRYQGHGRNRGDRGYARGNRPRVHTNNSTQNKDNNQNSGPKGVRGQGPQRYQPSFKTNTEVPFAQNKQSGKSVEKPSYVSSGRTSEPVSNAELDAARPRKQVFASSLSIASPPFYPSGPSTKDNVVPHKRDIQAGTINRNSQPSVVDENITMVQSSAVLRGKNTVYSIGMDKLYINDSHTTMTKKPSNTVQMSLSGSSSINSTQPQLRVQGRGITSSAQLTYQSVVSNNQADRVHPPTQLQTVQRNPSQSRSQSLVQTSGKQFTRLPRGSQASSPTKATCPVKAFEPGELETPSDSSKSKTPLVAKGKGSVKGTGRGSFLYGGAQVMGASGNMGSAHGDQNFPAFLPVMQFGGQRPGGIEVPAVGMAFPGYVSQSQLGLGNSEMTWLPVLAGAAGALGGAYCSPYLTVDGSYNSPPSGQTLSAAAASSKENNATVASIDWKPVQRPEPANDDFGQRQKNPRRYTEMKFDQ